MKTVAFFVGISAVIFYLLSYLARKRNSIITLNTTSRVLYIIQYVLLGAFEGAVLDIAGILSSVLAGRKHSGFIKKYTKLFFVLSSIFTIAAGLLI